MRQIKRNFFVDITSISFPEGSRKAKIEAVPLLRDYFETGLSEGRTFTREKGEKKQYFSSGQVSNLGWFRMYAEAYLKNHPVIDHNQTIVVRHRQSSEHGMPVQIYAFTNRTDFITYENVQSEIFEHLIIMAGEFGLRIYQQPSGYDVKPQPQTN